LSLPQDGDNPKDDPNWSIYPPPPGPAWYEEKDRANPTTGKNSQVNSIRTVWCYLSGLILETVIISETSALQVWSQTPLSPQTPKATQQEAEARPGYCEDFELEDCLPVPGLRNGHFAWMRTVSTKFYEMQKQMSLIHHHQYPHNPRVLHALPRRLLNVSSDGPARASHSPTPVPGRQVQFIRTSQRISKRWQTSKKVPHRDFYNVRKVDTHVHIRRV